MTSRVLFRGLAGFATFVLVGVVAVTAGTQPAPLRVVETSLGNLYLVHGSNWFTLVPDDISDSDLAGLNSSGEVKGAVVTQPGAPTQVVQAGDGTLYVVVGGNVWTLVPDQISDSDFAALNFGGEIDGTLGVPPLQAPAPAAPPAAAPINGTADLTGKAANDLPGTPIAVGATISSMVDQKTKPHDVFAIALAGDSKYEFLFSSPNKLGGSCLPRANFCSLHYFVANPDTTDLNLAATGNFQLADTVSSDDDGCAKNDCVLQTFLSVTYYLRIDASSANQQYMFTVKQCSPKCSTEV